MEHLFIKKNSQVPPLLLLHGTGGDETSIVELASYLAPTSSLLSLRGTVNENGANRYFRRFAEGQFDLADVAQQTEKLHQTIKDLGAKYDLSLTNLVIVGYSNGANIGANLLLNQSTEIKHGLFFHPMFLGNEQHTTSLKTKSVWSSYGKKDPLMTVNDYQDLVNAFQSRQATLTSYESAGGHQITQEELNHAHSWLKELI